MLPIRLPAGGAVFSVDPETCRPTMAGDPPIPFAIDADRREALMPA